MSITKSKSLPKSLPPDEIEEDQAKQQVRTPGALDYRWPFLQHPTPPPLFPARSHAGPLFLFFAPHVCRLMSLWQERSLEKLKTVPQFQVRIFSQSSLSWL